MFAKKKKSRPLPAVRRLAGQSLRDEWDRTVNDGLPFLIFGPAIIWMVWLVELLHKMNTTPPQPQFWLSFAILCTGMALIAVLRLRATARNLIRGERGELKVAEALEELRAFGYRVYHDLVRDKHNIDHVIVGPAGVFAIETKFRSGFGQIEFRNGEGLFVGGFPEEKDSLKQARDNAGDIGRMIKQDCGLNRWVKPLVVFVGDWKVKNKWQNTDARVFTTDQVGDYIRRQQPELTKREIELISSHLERSAKAC
jgi:hypothetical protein